RDEVEPETAEVVRPHHDHGVGPGLGQLVARRVQRVAETLGPVLVDRLLPVGVHERAVRRADTQDDLGQGTRPSSSPPAARPASGPTRPTSWRCRVTVSTAVRIRWRVSFTISRTSTVFIPMAKSTSKGASVTLGIPMRTVGTPRFRRMLA